MKEFQTEYDYYEAEAKIITKERAKTLHQELCATHEVNLSFNFELSAGEQQAARAMDFQDSTTAESREFWYRAKSQPVADLLQKH